MNIPFVNLGAMHAEQRAEIDAAIAEVIDKSSFIGGPVVDTFEKNFAAYCDAAYSVSCASGTDALKLALMAAGVKAGDEVITVPNTFIATVEGITMVGAHHEFVDIDPATYNMSPERLAEFIETRCHVVDGKLIDERTGRTVTAVLPVHLYGLPADLAPIMAIAHRYNLIVIEDACQAHGATYRIGEEDIKAGSFGAAAAFSFYPGKNLGAMGEGGAATTNDATMAAKMKVLREHGSVEKYMHISPDGWNGRLDTVQCAILDIKLRKLDEWNNRRRQAAEWYRARLEGDSRFVLPIEPEGSKHVYHLFVVRVNDREAVRKAMTERGIGVGLHYPVPLHMQEAYAGMGWKQGDFPESEAAASSILSLPMFPHITEEQVDYVCSVLKEVAA